MASSISEIWSFSWFHCSGFREIPFFPGFISPSWFIQYSLMSIRTLPLKSLTLTYLIFPIWNMLSSLLLLPLDEPLGLELSPLFGFLAGFSGALDFFLFACRECSSLLATLWYRQLWTQRQLPGGEEALPGQAFTAHSKMI